MRDTGFDDPGDGGGGYTPPPQTGQGWTIDATGDTITFHLAPAAGTNNITVKEYGTGTLVGSSKFAVGSWCKEYGYPSEIEFFADRLWLAGTPSDPQAVWSSQTGDYSHFGRSTPIIDSDAVTFTINARQVNAIMDLVPLDKMIVLAKGGEFLLRGGQDDVVTPSTISIKPQSYHGTGGVQAKVVGETAIFVKEQGQHVYDIGYSFETDGYRPRDLSSWADHLVEGYSILRMEWMPAPWSLLWFVRNDGVGLGCTYMPEQEVLGWHRHDTGRDLITAEGEDDIECIIALPGVKQTVLAVQVKRIVNGQVVRYIEQMAPAFVDAQEDACYLDSALTYDGRNTTATTITLTGGVDWLEDEDLTLTASAALFVGASDEDDGFTLYRTVLETDVTTGITSEVEYKVRLLIRQYLSATQVVVNTIGTVPAALRGVATSHWTFMRRTISGLGHLEGREVGVYADGSVHPLRTVASGAIDLQSPGGVVTVGLRYRSHIETLELNNPGGANAMDTKKLLTGLGMLVRNSRGIKACSGDLNEDRLYDVKMRQFEAYGEPTSLLTGYTDVPLSAQWGEEKGRVHIISDDPLPMEILAFVPKFHASEKIG